MDDVGSNSLKAPALNESLLHCLKAQNAIIADNGAPFTFVVRPLSDTAGAVEAAKTAFHAEKLVCHVSYDTARIVIGPIVWFGGSPCLQCLQLWAPTLEKGSSNLALPAPLIEGLAAQVLAYIEERRNGRTVGAESIWWFDADTLERSEHRLSPHPECHSCGSFQDRSGPFMTGERRVNINTWRENDRPDSILLSDRLVDSRFGLVRHFERETEALAHPMTFAAFIGREDPRQLDIGVGRSGCQALDQDIAILEALERFSSFRPRTQIETISARYADISSVAIDPRSFILPTLGESNGLGSGVTSFDPDMAYEWTWAHSLRRGRRMLIPLQFAYYDLPSMRLPAAQRLVFETSNGCALGSSIEEAALFGLFEVIERDAYMTTWYGQLTPRRLNAGGIADRHIAGMIARIEAAGFTVSILDVGVGFPIATVAVLAINERAIATAASHLSTGAHLNPTEALRGALVEVCSRIQHRPDAIVRASHARAAAMLLDDRLVQDMDDHGSLYAYHGSLHRLNFLISEDPQGALPIVSCPLGSEPDLNKTLRELANSVLAVAEDVLVVDLSNALTNSVGLRCVKVLAPGLLPVTFGHQNRRIASNRIAQAAAATGRLWDGSGTYLPHNFQ